MKHWKVNLVFSFLLRVFLLFCLPLQAQEMIQLTQDDLFRLGIKSSPVASIDNSVGASFPATVINSPLTTSTVTVPYSGIVQSWAVLPGENVSAGDILIQIRSSELLDLQNNWRNAQTELEQRRFELDKDNALLKQGIISRQRVIQTQRQFQQAESKNQALVAKLTLAGFSEAQLRAFNVNDFDLGVYSVRSPVSGNIDHLMVNAGVYVEANTVIASIGNKERWLSAQLPARISNRLTLGQDLRIVGSNNTLELRQKDFSINPQTQTIEVFAMFNSPPGLMTGQIVTLIIPAAESGVLIPDNAVVHSGDETTVYIQRGENFEARTLNLSPAGADYLATEGIAAGELVVIRGAAILKGIQLGLGGE